MSSNDDAALTTRAHSAIGDRRRRSLLGFRVLGHPLWVWLLWLAAALTMTACPTMLSDPGVLPYLLDPELLALLVLVGVQYSWLQLTLLRARVSARHHGSAPDSAAWKGDRDDEGALAHTAEPGRLHRGAER